MKALKITRAVLLIVAVALVGLALLLSPMMDDPRVLEAALGQVYPLVGWGFALLVAGTMFLFSKNHTVRALGVGFTVAIYTALLTFLFTDFGNAIAPMICAVASIVFAVSWIFEIIRYAVAHVRAEECEPEDDARVQAILKWRSLLDRKIITEEEFLAKRNKILGLEAEKPEKK